MKLDPRLIELRELLLSAPESTSTRVLFVSLSLLLAATVLLLVKRRTLREEYTPIWLAVAAAITLLSLSRPLLYFVTRSIGAWTPSSALFFFGELFLVAICLNYAVRLSRLALEVKNLAQELAVLRAELERRGAD
ncbi:MAG: DUF2304 domain-containing protein [Deltaproteobacteria bacterium]|nr:DUF2304 domain-containing protein [Deltaproteobacteria bacterium]